MEVDRIRTDINVLLLIRMVICVYPFCSSTLVSKEMSLQQKSAW